ncbi:MAG: 6-carboxytetrahydropterin synthase [Armatimonadetes bacterium]|nr:6-carboxytetrahydropterin synthase [Armatimonadota bacterium]
MSTRWAHIAVEFWFEASHQLIRAGWSEEENRRIFGACAGLHGHSYRLLIGIYGPVGPETGMVINFTELKRIVRAAVIQQVDHRHLNDLVPGLTTAENILYWIAGQLLPCLDPSLIERIELQETRTSASYLSRDDLRRAFPEAYGEGG